MKFAEDFKPATDVNRIGLENTNEWMRNHYVANSTTGMNFGCAYSLTKGKLDSNLTAIQMLQLGLVDYVIDRNNGTAEIRASETFNYALSNAPKTTANIDFIPSYQSNSFTQQPSSL